MDTSSSQMSCVLRLNIQTRGWDKSMHKLFKGIQDVTYTIDARMGLAYVTGKIIPEIILRIGKSKKHVQLIHISYGHRDPPGAAQPYMYYHQIPYKQPQVAYPYFYHHC